MKWRNDFKSQGCLHEFYWILLIFHYFPLLLSGIAYPVPNLHGLMPLGIVCQLRYHGGGLLKNRGAEESLLPFWSSATPLQVGQTVHFLWVKRGGHHEATDLQVVKPFEEKIPTIQPSQSKPEFFESSGTCNPNLWNPKQHPDLSPAVSLPVSLSDRQLRQLRQLQRQRFHNASEAERRRWLQRAEELLMALRSAEDGDGIIRWVYRLAAWLQPRSEGKDRCTEDTEDIKDDEVKDCENGLQNWVRRLLIWALSSLDLEDLNTYQKVELALNYIAELLGKEKREVPEVLPKNPSLALQQWHQLRSLIRVEAPDDWSDRPSGPSDPGAGTRARRENMKGKDKSSSMDGIYRPNARVRSLPSVSIGDQVELQCVHCSERLHSSWYWFHPKKETAYVLAPQFGHAVCTKKVGKLCNWRSVGQTPTVLDNYHHLDFCQHKKRRSACIECEGTDICQHKRQRSHCRLCKAKNKAVKMDRHALKRITEICRCRHRMGWNMWNQNSTTQPFST